MRIDTVEKLFAENKSNFKSIITQIDHREFNRKPDEDNWAAAEEFHHIYLVKRKVEEIAKRLNAEMKKAKEVSMTEIPVREGFRKITYERMPAIPLPGTEPSNAFSKEQLFEMVTDASMELEEYFQDGKRYDGSSVTAEHPFVGPMNYYEWFFMDGMHEKGHLEHMLKKHLK